jgi:hypothetical protein
LAALLQSRGRYAEAEQVLLAELADGHKPESIMLPLAEYQQSPAGTERWLRYRLTAHGKPMCTGVDRGDVNNRAVMSRAGPMPTGTLRRTAGRSTDVLEPLPDGQSLTGVRERAGNVDQKGTEMGILRISSSQPDQLHDGVGVPPFQAPMQGQLADSPDLHGYKDHHAH